MDTRINTLLEYYVLFTINFNSRKDGVFYTRLRQNFVEIFTSDGKNTLDQILDDFFKQKLIISVGYDLTFEASKEDKELILVATSHGKRTFQESKADWHDKLVEKLSKESN